MAYTDALPFTSTDHLPEAKERLKLAVRAAGRPPKGSAFRIRTSRPYGEPWHVVEYRYDHLNPVHNKYRERLLNATYEPPVDRSVKSFEYPGVGTIKIVRNVRHSGGQDHDMGYYSVKGPSMGSGGRVDQWRQGEAYGFIDDKFKSTVSAGRGKSAAIKRAVIERARQELGLPPAKLQFTGGTLRGPRRKRIEKLASDVSKMLK